LLRYAGLIAGQKFGKKVGAFSINPCLEGSPISIRTPLALLLLSLVAIASVWWWISTPVHLVRAPIDPSAKLECVSYAPFRDGQSPMVPGLIISPAQIAQDMAQLAKISKCVRTYAVDNGLDKVPQEAAKVGLKVMLGVWISSNRAKNAQQIATAAELTKQYPDVISAVIVGNEVLLRGEMLAGDLVAAINAMKARVTVPVTYADVWEFWLRHREIYNAVDFVTIHILPFWEDFPVKAQHAAAHVDSIRKRMGIAFPDKEILIGETGWPSAGRMREGALPSRTNQARVVSEILDLASRENFRVNLIEAYDQPWKRRFEGTVGGYWGLFDAGQRSLKYPAGVAVSDFPFWQWQMGAGLAYCLLVFTIAGRSLRHRPWPPRWPSWTVVAISATVGGILLGIAIEKMFVESLGLGNWLRWGLLCAAAIASPLLVASAIMRGRSLPAFSDLLAPSADSKNTLRTYLLGGTLLVTTLIATETGLGFVFDQRYRDFPFAALTMAVVPLLLLTLLNQPKIGDRPLAESVFAGLLVLSLTYIGFNEGSENWQSLWTCGAYLMLALTLLRARAVQNRG
jgi:exo-beta-1,3-glucanase (GH17 family)